MYNHKEMQKKENRKNTIVGGITAIALLIAVWSVAHFWLGQGTASANTLTGGKSPSTLVRKPLPADPHQGGGGRRYFTAPEGL